MTDNVFLPSLAQLTDVRDLATGIKLFRCRLLEGGCFDYAPGQFGFLSAIGVGESPFGFAVSRHRSAGQVEFAVRHRHSHRPARDAGRHVVGVRGPVGAASTRQSRQERRHHRRRHRLCSRSSDIIHRATGDLTIFCAGRG
jgi:NAD(P)H-flavin reductase